MEKQILSNVAELLHAKVSVMSLCYRIVYTNMIADLTTLIKTEEKCQDAYYNTDLRSIYILIF